MFQTTNQISSIQNKLCTYRNKTKSTIRITTKHPFEDSIDHNHDNNDKDDK